MKRLVYLLVIALLLINCSNSGVDSNDNNDSPINEDPNGDQNNDDNNSNTWLIPVSEIFDGGPGKDGIPSIDNPQFINNTAQNFLNDDDLVIGIYHNGVARAYPHEILDYHEIVNDNINGLNLTINYCPLTGTAFGWESLADGMQSSYGVSGLIYKANLILYDRNTDSHWSQLRLQCVNGELIGNRPKVKGIVETSWGTWKNLYPNTQVLSLETGFQRPYGEYPYGPYKDIDDFFIFNVTPLNDELPYKERVHAIFDGNKSKVYRFPSFDGGKVIRDTFFNKNYLIIGNDDIIKSFILPPSYSSLNFEFEITDTGGLFKDNQGNVWSASGVVISGPLQGQQLTESVSVMGFWFAIATFYPNPLIYVE